MSQRKPCIVSKRTQKRTGFSISKEDFAVGGIATIAGFVIVFYAMYVLIINSFTSVPIDFTAYHAWLETISWSTGIGVIILAVAAIFIMRSYREFVFVFVVSILIGILIVVWIDYLRPADAIILFDIAQYNMIKNLIVFLEILVLVTFVIGIVWKPVFKCSR